MKKLFAFICVLALATISCQAAANLDGKEYSFETGPQDLSQLEIPTAQAVEEAQGENPVAEVDGDAITLDGVTRVNFPKKAYPVRWGGTVQPQQKCPEYLTNWIFCDDGVLSYDHANGHDEFNPSAVWSGGAQVDNLLENLTGRFSCPEAGWMKVTLPEAKMTWVHPVTGQTMSLNLEPVPGRSYTVVFQCAYEGEGDRSTQIYFQTSENGAGNVKIMRYPVPAEHSGFFSWEHLLEDLVHARNGTDNCGSGGCPQNILVGIGMNEGSFGQWIFNGEGLDLSETNVYAPPAP